MIESSPQDDNTRFTTGTSKFSQVCVRWNEVAVGFLDSRGESTVSPFPLSFERPLPLPVIAISSNSLPLYEISSWSPAILEWTR